VIDVSAKCKTAKQSKPTASSSAEGKLGKIDAAKGRK
jgi:hypothetical protein